MKKLCIGLLVFVLSVGVSLDFVKATSNTRGAYEKVKNHYAQNYDVLSSLEEIYAIESLGLEVESGNYEYQDLLNKDFTKLSAKEVAQYSIAFVLLGMDPHDIDGIDLIKIVESSVQADGSIIDPKYGTKLSAVYQVWCVNALYMSGSERTQLAADGLANLQVKEDTADDFKNDKGGFGSEWGNSTDITGWCVETLSVVNKERYQETLQSSIDYFARKQNDDAGWKSDNQWLLNTNADTMACVISALSAYDKKGLTQGTYNKNGVNPLDTFLMYQSSDGRFMNTLNSQANDYSTWGASLGLSAYEQTSHIEQVKVKYQDLYKEEIPEKTPVITPEDKPTANGPETSDETSVYGWLFGLLVSGFVLVSMHVKYEKN